VKYIQRQLFITQLENSIMKKTFLVLATGAMLLGTSCNKSVSNEDSLPADEAVTASSQRRCSSYEVLEEEMKADPSRKQRLEAIENFTRGIVENPTMGRLLANGDIEIPVVFNVIYKTNAQNVSLAQLQSQIDVLNEDFAATNSDYGTSNPFNAAKSGDCNIRFVLESVNRKKTSKTSWSTNNAMKTASQGIAATSPTTKLNIWVCNMGGGILGYAQFPGGAAATDGVVLDDNATGRVGTAAAPFDLGRTATHEVGHWLNLRHIWGDATCGNDQVSDTPLHNTSNGGCPTAGHTSTCTGTPLEMYMNYMDYTNDACMYMFSLGQRARMQATFAAGGPRNTFAQP
jgi:hypothetical protein